MAQTVSQRSELGTLTAVCHHCGRWLSNEDVKVIENDDFFSGSTKAFHCAKCYHAIEKRSYGWGRWLRRLAKLLLGLLFLLLVGSAIAALVQSDAFGLAAVWQRAWLLAAPYWDAIGPILDPILTAFQPLVDVLKELLAQVL